MNNPNPFPSYWTPTDEGQPVMTLPIGTTHIRTPAHARHFAAEAGMLADLMVKRGEQPIWPLLIRDLQSALNDHARHLDERIDAQVARHAESIARETGGQS